MTSVKLAFVLPPYSAVNRMPRALKWIVTERREKSQRERGLLINLFLFVTKKNALLHHLMFHKSNQIIICLYKETSRFSLKLKSFC